MMKNNTPQSTPEFADYLKSSKHVHGALLMLGWDGVQHWAQAHGYHRDNVHHTLARWCGRTDGKQPVGHISKRVLVDLERTVKSRLSPADVLQNQPV